MLVRDLKDCKEFTAGENTSLQELLHPDKADLKLRYSLAHATMKPGKTTCLHRLKTSEVYYILQGEGLMFIEDDSCKVYPGQAVYIPPNSRQYIKNTGDRDLKFLCIVDPAWRAEDEEVL